MVGFCIATLLSGVTALVHGVVGSKEVTQPLLESDVPLAERYTLLLAWHGTTIALAVMTLGFAWAALGLWQLGAINTLFAGVFMLWGLALQAKAPVRFKDLPQWTLFAAIAAAGLWSLAVEVSYG